MGKESPANAAIAAMPGTGGLKIKKDGFLITL